MELAEPLETGGDSPLARARLHRQLTVEETARRAGLTPDEVRWLEEGRVYRFPTPDDALLATVVYATALGIAADEARELAGLPVEAKPIRRNPAVRALVAAGLLIVLGIVLGAVFVPHGSGSHHSRAPAVVLPPRWRVPVDVLNGSGDVVYTRRVADRVLAFGYRVPKVGRADNFRYHQTAVYFPPGCQDVALRLATDLGVPDRPLPGGTGPCSLYVIVGPARGPGE